MVDNCLSVDFGATLNCGPDDHSTFNRLRVVFRPFLNRGPDEHSTFNRLRVAFRLTLNGGPDPRPPFGRFITSFALLLGAFVPTSSLVRRCSYSRTWGRASFHHAATRHSARRVPAIWSHFHRSSWRPLRARCRDAAGRTTLVGGPEPCIFRGQKALQVASSDQEPSPRPRCWQLAHADPPADCFHWGPDHLGHFLH